MPCPAVHIHERDVRVIWTDREKLFPAPDLELWVQPAGETEWKLVAMEMGERTLTTKLPWSQLSGAVRAKAWLDAPAIPKGLEVRRVHKAWVARPGERELSVAPGHLVKLVHTDQRWAYVLATDPPSKTAGEEVKGWVPYDALLPPPAVAEGTILDAFRHPFGAEGYLTAAAGDRIKVLQKLPSWVYGTVRSEAGWLPESAVLVD